MHVLRKPSSSVSVKHKHLRTKGTFFQYSSARCPTRILTLSALSRLIFCCSTAQGIFFACLLRLTTSDVKYLQTTVFWWKISRCFTRSCTTKRRIYGKTALVVNFVCRGGSRGRMQGLRTPPPNWYFAKKKTMWFIGVEVEQETSAPSPKKILDPPLVWAKWRSNEDNNREFKISPRSSLYPPQGTFRQTSPSSSEKPVETTVFVG